MQLQIPLKWPTLHALTITNGTECGGDLQGFEDDVGVKCEVVAAVSVQSCIHSRHDEPALLPESLQQSFTSKTEQ